MATVDETIIENVINKFEAIGNNMGDLINNQNNALVQLATMSEQLKQSRQKISQALLDVAYELNHSPSGLGKYGVKLEEVIVKNQLLDAPYDYQAAFNVHKALFTDRHEMALFLHQHLPELKRNVLNRTNGGPKEIEGKIKVFSYWHSNNNLPEIITLCRHYFEKYLSAEKFELIILDENSYSKWIEPSDLADLPEMHVAHFTDLLRLRLLERWGGFWIDATCLLTQDFYQASKIIRQQEQFMFVYSGSRVGNWFIWSKPNNYVIAMIAEALTLWWRKEKRLTNYFLNHDITEMLYWLDSEYRKLWDGMQKLHPGYALAVFRSYKKACSDDEFKTMINNSFVHKITYKYETNKIVKNGTLDRILQGQIDKAIKIREQNFDFNKVTGKQFIFSRRDGSSARKMRLAESGLIENIEGGGNNNEYSWAVENNELVFKNKDNNITSIYYEVLNNNGKFEIYGNFKNNLNLQFKLTEI